MQFKKRPIGMWLQMPVRRSPLTAAPVAGWVLAVATLAGAIGCGKQDATPPAATDGTTAGGAADAAVSGADVVADGGAGVDQGSATADSAADAEVAAIDSLGELPTVPEDSDAGQVESEPETAPATETVAEVDAGPVPDGVGGPEAEVGVGPSDADVALTGDDTVDVSSADAADAVGDVVATDAKVDIAPPPECALPTDCSAVLGPSADPCKGPVCSAGKCGWAALPVGATCDTDGLTCTGEKCAADGQCEFGGLIVGWCGIQQDGKSLCVAAGGLNLKNPCEVCDPAANLTKWSLLDDGAKCGPTAKGCVTQTCKGGACVKTPDFSLCAAVTGGADCKYPSCDPSFGCLALNVPATSVCIGADGLPCTVEKCDGKGSCVATGETEVGLCTDGVTCTTDECNSTLGCVNSANSKLCNDGNSCTADACDTAKGGCTNAPVGGNCDDGADCTYVDQCENGSCVGKEPQVWSTVLKTTGATILDVVDRSDGVYTAGTHGEELVVSHLDPSGTFAWEAMVANVKWKQAGLVNLGAGGVAVVGDSAPAGTYSFVPKIVQIDKAGKVAATVDIPGVDAAAASNGNGPVWALGYRVKVPLGSDTGKVGVVEGRGPDLKPVWKLQLKAATMSIGAIRQTADKFGWFVVGDVNPALGSDMDQPFVYRVNADGTLVWQQRYFGFETDGRLFDVVALADGGGIGVGSQDGINATQVPMAMRFNAAGGLIWKRTFSLKELSNTTLFGAPVSDGGEGIWANSWETHYAKPDVESVAVHIDGGGNVVQQHNLGALVLATTGNTATGTITLASSSLAVNPKLTLPATVFRTSGLFASQCKDVGKCFGLAGKLCADGKPCTTDSCDAAKGCVHTDLGDGVACHDGDSCTAADACAKAGCTAGPPVLLSVDVTGIMVESAFAAEDGSIYACGPSKYDGSDVIVVKLASSGVLAWKAKLDLPAWADCKAARMWDGNLRLRGNASGGDFLAIVSPDGTVKSVSVDKSTAGKFALSQRVYSKWKDGIAGFVMKDKAISGSEYDAWIDGALSNVVIEGPDDEIACDIVLLPDGTDAALVSNMTTGALSLTKVSGSQVLSTTPFGGAKLKDASASFSAPRLVSTSSAELLVLSVVDTSTPPNYKQGLRLAVVSAGGKVIADKILAENATQIQLDILALPSGGYLIAASRNYPGFFALPWVARFDANHVLQWEETGKNEWSNGSRLFAHPAGGLLIQHGKYGVGTRFRVIDAWGNGTCAQSGACFAKAVSDCDDGKPCTADACTADAVCSHTAIAGCGP